MNNGVTNGSNDKDRDCDIHRVICSLGRVLKYDYRNSEGGSGIIGTLCLCHFGVSLCVTDFDDSEDCYHRNTDTIFYVSLPCIKKVQLSVDHKPVDFVDVSSFDIDYLPPVTLTLYCKDFREIVITLPSDKDDGKAEFLTNLWRKLYQNVESPDSYSSQSGSKCVSSFLDKESWEIEISRLMGKCKKVKWKVIENKMMEKDGCPIIGPYTVVPETISSGGISETHHTNHRYMTWCWTDTETMVSLLRCSEPKTILNERYLSSILRTVNNGKTKTHDVIHTAKLKDSCPDEEQISHSFDKLWSAFLLKDCDSFYKNVESSKWLHYIQSFIRASRHISRTLKCDKVPVVVYDSSGRDISCLIVSLVLILCDKHCRTVKGFANLVNKEWVAAGYPFCAQLMSINAKFVPTFIMFLDCVQNIIKQYPAEFEFTELYLITILDAIFAGDSELFKFNSPKDMAIIFKGKETSVVQNFWSKVLKDEATFHNPLFQLKHGMLNSNQQPDAHFDEKIHRARAESYSYAVSKGVEQPDEVKRKRLGSTMLKSIMKKPWPKSRKKSKSKKEKVEKIGASSFYEPPRERLTSIKNIFKSKFDPINVNYSMINIHIWDRYYLRYSGALDDHSEAEEMLHQFVKNISLSCSGFFESNASEDSSENDEVLTNDMMTKSVTSETIEQEKLIRSDSATTINSATTVASDKMERSIHVSEIDLCNDHEDKDYESAEELSLNGLEGSLEGSLHLQSVPISENEGEKRLSHVVEELEMSHSKSPQTVELEIAEATNDIHDV